MKNILITILAIFICVCTRAQCPFTASNSTLQWQEIFEYNATIKNVIDNITLNNYLSEVRVNGSTITCLISPVKLPFEELGYSRGNIPMYMVLNDFSAVATIQIKEDRFRVTVERMKLTSNTTTSMSLPGETVSLDYYAIRNGSLNAQFLKKSAVIIDHLLNKIFSHQPTLDDNW